MAHIGGARILARTTHQVRDHRLISYNG